MDKHLENRMTVRKGIPRPGKCAMPPLLAIVARSRVSAPTPGTRRRNGAGGLIGENGKGKQTEEMMKDNLSKRLPPLERRLDGSLYRMTPAQRKQANAPIRRTCCNWEDGNCILLDDGDAHTCPQTISFSVCCKWFRWAVLPQDKTLKAELYRGRDLKRCAVCGGVFFPRSNWAKYCPACAAGVHRRQKTESERKRRSAVDN